MDEFEVCLVKEQKDVGSGKSEWAVNYNIPHNAVNGLLPIFKSIPGLAEMPKDARTILKTSVINSTESIHTVDPGFYHHFGLGLAIQQHFKYTSINNIEVIKVVIGIDGLPLAKSSSSQLWPILDSNEFLREFVNEIIELTNDGITIDGTIKQVEIDGFSLDAPAKSFILKIKGHSGFDSCTRCTIEWEYLKNRTCFPYSSTTIKRSHSDYINRNHEEHHVGNSISILKELPINIISSFGLDYMHLTCLGVMRKLIHLWVDKGPLNVRLPSSVSKKLSLSLLSLRDYVPCEFSRKPRGLNDLNRFKATEFRQILIYTGQVVFKNILNNDCYKHFMALSIAMNILLNSNMANYVIYAQNLLNYFVQTFETLYGRHFMSFNIHGLVHISDDYKRFGPLDNIAAFPFENFLKSFKKMIRKHDKPLQQIIRRCNERNFIERKIFEQNLINCEQLKHKDTDGPLLENLIGVQYKKLYFKNIKIKVGDNANSFILNDSNDIIKVENIISLNKTNEIFIIGKVFEVKKAFYEKPIPSTLLNIYVVNNLSVTHKYWSYNCIKNKIMLLELNEQKIAIPVIHDIDGQLIIEFNFIVTVIMWIIVCFEEENCVEVVPDYWYKNGHCAWPKKSIKNYKKYIDRRIKPNEIDFDYFKARAMSRNI
ncbi:Uncharacterized protein FWK35_00033241, partial [Aphis craccivora]